MLRERRARLTLRCRTIASIGERSRRSVRRAAGDPGETSVHRRRRAPWTRNVVAFLPSSPSRFAPSRYSPSSMSASTNWEDLRGAGSKGSVGTFITGCSQFVRPKPSILAERRRGGGGARVPRQEGGAAAAGERR
eukprot:9501836-Pyramimonas_sp.AAC.2